MPFIEMTGKTLMQITTGQELTHDDLKAAGVGEESLVRVNPQGDIEVRKSDGWEIIGGLLGDDFKQRVEKATGLDWA